MYLYKIYLNLFKEKILKIIVDPYFLVKFVYYFWALCWQHVLEWGMASMVSTWATCMGHVPMTPPPCHGGSWDGDSFWTDDRGVGREQ